MTLKNHTHDLLSRLGVASAAYTGGELAVTSPLTGEVIAQVKLTSVDTAIGEIDKSKAAFKKWRDVPAPLRGELVRLFGEELSLKA